MDRGPASKFIDPANKTKSIAQSAYEMLREEIVTLKRPPGSALSDKKISSELGISRTPLREAFLKLLEEDLIVVIPSSGTYVTKIQVNSLRESYFIRKALEGAAVSDFVDMATNKDIDRLEEILNRQKDTLNKDRQEFYKIDNQFHHHIFEVTQHQKAWDIVVTVKAQLDRVRYLTIIDETRMIEIIKEHQQVISDIRNRKKDDASQSLMSHIDYSFSIIEKTISSYRNYFD